MIINLAFGWISTASRCTSSTVSSRVQGKIGGCQGVRFPQLNAPYIQERASGYCEYCKFPFDFSHDAFHIEHIIPLHRKGSDRSTSHVNAFLPGTVIGYYAVAEPMCTSGPSSQFRRVNYHLSEQKTWTYAQICQHEKNVDKFSLRRRPSHRTAVTTFFWSYRIYSFR